MSMIKPVFSFLKKIFFFESDSRVNTEKSFLDIAAEFFDILHQGMCLEENITTTLPSEKPPIEATKLYLDNKKTFLKEHFINSAHTINQVAQFIFRISKDVLVNPFNYPENTQNVNFTEILEFKKYQLKICFSEEDFSKYTEIYDKYQNYLKNAPRTRLNSNNIFFDDTLKQIKLTFTLDELLNFSEIDPISNERIIDITWGMEITYKFFGVPVEIEKI